MRIFDRIDPKSLDRRELHLWILALTVISVLAVGVALLMYPTVFSNQLSLTNSPGRAFFFGFCGLSALFVGYFVDRQMVIRHLRAELKNEKLKVVQIRQEASADLLTTLPGFSQFCDRLAMEFRRASHIQQPLSLLAVELKPSRNCTDSGEVEAIYGEAAKALMRKLRGEDSIFLFAEGTFGIVLPAVSAHDAYYIRDRLMDGLHDAAGASNRFSFAVKVVNFPEHVGTARELEESVRDILPDRAIEDPRLEPVTLSTGIQ